MKDAEIIKALLLYTDKRTLAEANTDPEYIDDALLHMNKAAQELYSLAPDYINKQPRGAVLNQPKQVTCTTTLSSNVFNISSGWEAWMEGCVFRAENAPDNRIISYSSPNATMQLPATQSATFQAWVYADSVKLDADVISVLPNPEIAGQHYLRPAYSEHQLKSSNLSIQDGDYGFVPAPHTNYYSAPGTPNFYYVNAIRGRFYLRVLPVPDRIYLVSYDAKIKPTKIVKASLDVANEGASSTTSLVIPLDWFESYYMPIALQHYTASPFFKNTDVKPEIAREYREAINNFRANYQQSDTAVIFTPGM